MTTIIQLTTKEGLWQRSLYTLQKYASEGIFLPGKVDQVHLKLSSFQLLALAKYFPQQGSASKDQKSRMLYWWK